MSDPLWYCPVCFSEYIDETLTNCPADGSPLSRCDEREKQWVGQVIDGKYKIIRFVGAGGMADVFEAERLGTGKRLALKLLKTAFTGDATLMERFRQEAMMISLIAHRNVVALQDFGVSEGGGTYMAMELLKGYPLADALLKGPMDPATVFDLVLQTCEGMAAAHERGVVHRDLKPDNLFVQLGPGKKQTIKILDLGIGKLFSQTRAKGLTMAGTVVGTPAYMSPEQCKGEESLEASDIYSLGVVMYEMLFGQVPFDATSPILILPMHISEPPRWDDLAADCLGVPDAAKQVILKALSKKPEDRQPSMLALQHEVAGLATAIRRQVRQSNSAAAPYSVAPTRPTRPAKKNSDVEANDTQQARRRAMATQPTIVEAPAVTAAGSPKYSPLAEKQAKKDPVRKPIALADGIYFVGVRHGESLECNSYLRVFEGNGHKVSMLIDPGPPRDFDAVAQNVAAVLGDIDRLNYLFINHQDPDVAANAAAFQRKSPGAMVICSEDTWRLARHYGLDPKRYIPTRILPNLSLTFNSGHTVSFLPTPFCHERGAVMVFDQKAKVLFSGDLFGGTESGKGMTFGEQSLFGIRTFHQIYMPSKRALDRAIRMVNAIRPAPLMIAPQHGNIIPTDQIRGVLDDLARLRVGVDLIESNERDTGSINVANEMLNTFGRTSGTQHKRAMVRHLSKHPTLVAMFEMGEPDRIVGIRVDGETALSTLKKELLLAAPAQLQGELTQALTDAARPRRTTYSRVR